MLTAPENQLDLRVERNVKTGSLEIAPEQQYTHEQKQRLILHLKIKRSVSFGNHGRPC